MKPILGQAIGGADVPIDVDRLVQSRMLLTANSGGGKSWALRRLLEQTHGAVQQLVLDPEGEFFTLREHYDYVLAGKGGDCPAEPRSAAMLAKRMLELRTSAIMDLYELKPAERVRFVRLFLQALNDAPRELWHPVLVVIDEAHKFAPEQGHGSAESSDAVAQLMSAGRKKGQCGVLATQRLSKLSKDAAAEANNLLIGRTVLDLDVARAGATLGMTKGQAFATLQPLKPGTFFAFGPALVDLVTELKVGDVRTSHPEAGEHASKPPPPRERVRKILAQLADLPAEAEAEAKTIGEALERIKALERDLAAAKRAQPATKIQRIEVPALSKADERDLHTQIDRMDKCRETLLSAAVRISTALDRMNDIREGDVPTAAVRAREQALAARGLPAKGGGAASTPAVDHRSDRGSPRRQSPPSDNPYLQDLLDAAARLQALGRDWVDRRRWAALAGKSPRSSSFEKHVAAARAQGLIEYGTGGTVRLTDLGLARAAPVDKVPSGRDLAEAFKASVLEPAQGRLLDALMEAGEPLTREELGARAGQSPKSSSFEKHVAGMRALGLVEYGPSGSGLVMLGDSVKVA